MQLTPTCTYAGNFTILRRLHCTHLYIVPLYFQVRIATHPMQVDELWGGRTPQITRYITHTLGRIPCTFFSTDGTSVPVNPKQGVYGKYLDDIFPMPRFRCLCPPPPLPLFPRKSVRKPIPGGGAILCDIVCCSLVISHYKPYVQQTKKTSQQRRDRWVPTSS